MSKAAFHEQQLNNVVDYLLTLNYSFKKYEAQVNNMKIEVSFLTSKPILYLLLWLNKMLWEIR